MEPGMKLQEIRSQVDRRPFRPFRICMSDGTEHVVSDPNLDTVMVGVLRDGEDVPDHAMYCDTVHITRVETMDAE